MKIPTKVFEKYREVANLMLDLTGFGITCKLVFTDKIEEVSSVPDIKQMKTMTINKSPSSGFNRGDSSFRMVETFENIVLRVYWTKKDFKKFASVEVPDGTIMTIGNLSDLPKINKCKALVINTATTGHVEWRFEKTSEPVIHGLDNSSFMCFWNR